MMRRLAWPISVAVAVILIACSSDKGTTSGGFPDPDARADGAGTTDGATTDSAAQDSAADSPTDAGGDEDSAVTGTFALTSTAFAAGANIPAMHTCNGANESPPLAWTNAPAGTQSYAVVMRDISLAGQPNYHWVIYDIPAASTSLPQAVQSVAAPATPAGAKQTYWSFGANYSYRGPCPPSLHEYQFTVYSFSSATIAVPGGTTDPAVADGVIQANKTGSASITGKYMQ
jgi:Raf kinase inhibitor-like YbhB/YbcL family protein